jgi:hypothetical protein
MSGQQPPQPTPQQQPTPVATQSTTLPSPPPGGGPTTVVVTQPNNPAVGVVNLNGVRSLVVGVDLIFTFLNENGQPVTNATVSETVTDSEGHTILQATEPVPLNDKGQARDIVSNNSGPMPTDAAGERKALEFLNKDFTSEQTLKATVKTSNGTVIKVTQKRTLTNMTPGAPKLANGLIRGYTFTMQKPTIEIVK